MKQYHGTMASSHCGKVGLTFKIPRKDSGYVHVHVSVWTYLITCINISMVLQEDLDCVMTSSLYGMTSSLCGIVVSSLTGIVEGGHPRLQERRES